LQANSSAHQFSLFSSRLSQPFACWPALSSAPSRHSCCGFFPRLPPKARPEPPAFIFGRSPLHGLQRQLVQPHALLRLPRDDAPRSRYGPSAEAAIFRVRTTFRQIGLGWHRHFGPRRLSQCAPVPAHVATIPGHRPKEKRNRIAQARGAPNASIAPCLSSCPCPLIVSGSLYQITRRSARPIPLPVLREPVCFVGVRALRHIEEPVVNLS